MQLCVGGGPLSCYSKKRGRKPNFKSPEKLAIKRCILHLNDQGKKVNGSVIKNECQIKESTRTIQGHLAKIGMRYVSVKKKIFLTKNTNKIGLKW